MGVGAAFFRRDGVISHSLEPSSSSSIFRCLFLVGARFDAKERENFLLTGDASSTLVANPLLAVGEANGRDLTFASISSPSDTKSLLRSAPAPSASSRIVFGIPLMMGGGMVISVSESISIVSRS